MINYLYYKKIYPLLFKRGYGEFGRNSVINNPLKIQGKKNIFIGENSIIESFAWLASLPHTGLQCKLIIGNRVQIGHFSHIYATNEIIIEDQVLIADKVYIADNTHQYQDVDTPIMDQKVIQLKRMKIGSGSWLGENVCVLGSSIGKQCIIGANSVVTKDIPDFSVAVGSPAKIIKKYNHNSKKWESV